MLLQRLVTLWIKNESLIPVFYGLVSISATGSRCSRACCSRTVAATLHFSGAMAACVQHLGKGNNQKSSTREAARDAWTRRRGEIRVHGSLRVAASEVEAPLTLCSCIQNLPPLCKKLLLMPYLLKEPTH